MELQDFLSHMDSGAPIEGGSEQHRFMHHAAQEAFRVTAQIQRRSAVEPVIGHLKSGHRMNRNCLAGKTGDAINAVLAAAGYHLYQPA